MADAGEEGMLVTSPSNRSTCEICGNCPTDVYARNQTARQSGYRYAQTRRNRQRVDPGILAIPAWVARLERDGIPIQERVGKLACGECTATIWESIRNERAGGDRR